MEIRLIYQHSNGIQQTLMDINIWALILQQISYGQILRAAAQSEMLRLYVDGSEIPQPDWMKEAF